MSLPDAVKSEAAEPLRQTQQDAPAAPVHQGPPVHEAVGGSSVRRYLNEHLTLHLLEGLKMVSLKKPHDPLRELGEFLIARSNELRGAPGT